MPKLPMSVRILLLKYVFQESDVRIVQSLTSAIRIHPDSKNWGVFKFDILISTKTLSYIKASYSVPVMNEIVPSKICKTVMKQKIKR